MTAISAISKNGTVWMGGDSAGTNSNFQKTIRTDPKVFKVGKFLIGYSGSYRMGQLLRFGWTPPEQPNTQDDFEYLCTAFIDSVRDRFKTGGFAKIMNGEEGGGAFLLGYRGTLYRVDSDYQVGIPADQIDATGCGSDLVLGSLYSTKGKPKDRIQISLEAAERYSAGVAGPFVILSAR